MSWTLEKIARLRELAAQNLTARDIAERIGGVTRNAVVGKCHREEIPLFFQPAPKRDTPKPKPVRTERKQFAPVEPIGVKDLPTEKSRCAVSIIGLTEMTCRWPISGERDMTLFCGARAVKDRPYCSCHCQRAYRPVRGRMEEAA